jgi:hypothetical protein
VSERHNDAAVKIFLHSIYYRREIDAVARRRLWRVARAYFPAIFQPWYTDRRFRNDPYVKETQPIHEAIEAFRQVTRSK